MGRRGNQEGSIRKRKDGRWEGRISVDGRQRSFYGKTRVEVSRKIREAQRKVDRGLPLADERVTLGKHLEHWLETSVKPSVRPATFASYESHVRLHIGPALGKVPLAKLQPQHVQKLMNAKLDEGLSANTVLRIRATLRKALNQAIKWGLIDRNVATLVDPPKAERYRVEPITPEEATAILEAVKGHRLSALFTTLLGVGLRLGEGLGLRWDDVDLEAGTLTVRFALQKIEGEYQLVEPKSELSRRTLVLPEFVTAALRRHRAAQSRERLVAGGDWDDQGLVFTTDRGQPLDNSNVHHSFRRQLVKAGVRSLRIHDLRHGCASLMLAKGVSPRVVMETLGHSQISLTMNTYAHVMMSLREDAARKMDEILGSRGQS